MWTQDVHRMNPSQTPFTNSLSSLFDSFARVINDHILLQWTKKHQLIPPIPQHLTSESITQSTFYDEQLRKPKDQIASYNTRRFFFASLHHLFSTWTDPSAIAASSRKTLNKTRTKPSITHREERAFHMGYGQSPQAQWFGGRWTREHAVSRIMTRDVCGQPSNQETQVKRHKEKMAWQSHHTFAYSHGVKSPVPNVQSLTKKTRSSTLKSLLELRSVWEVPTKSWNVLRMTHSFLPPAILVLWIYFA